MKSKVFLRISKDGSGKIKVDASTTSKTDPLKKTESYGRSKPLPTVFIALNLEIPDEAFVAPNIYVSITIPLEKVGTAIEIIDPLRLL